MIVISSLYLITYLIYLDCWTDKLQILPPVVEENTVWPLLETYDSFDDYYAIMKPLLLLETWQQVSFRWDSAESVKAHLFNTTHRVRTGP